jgi:hypothetical protein
MKTTRMPQANPTTMVKRPTITNFEMDGRLLARTSAVTDGSLVIDPASGGDGSGGGTGAPPTRGAAASGGLPSAGRATMGAAAIRA